MIKNKVIRFDRDELEKLTIEYFMKESKTKDEKKLDRILKIADPVRKDLLSKVDLRAVISETDKVEYDGVSLHVDDVIIPKINLNFSLIPGDKIYSFVLCSGDFELETGDKISEVFADLWGTAYVYACEEILRKEISKLEEGRNLSAVFGPGYHGMRRDNLREVFKLADGALIDVHLTESNVMIPLKSCAGFIVASDHELNKSENCDTCVGNVHGCASCIHYMNRNK